MSGDVTQTVRLVNVASTKIEYEDIHGESDVDQEITTATCDECCGLHRENGVRNRRKMGKIRT